jgi:LmbE family N-acetylglucosaminyl deacetylase
MRKLILSLLAFAIVCRLVSVVNYADTRPAAEDRGAGGLALALRRLQTIGSALHIAAHPDDESTELLAYLARGQGIRAAYLSLNRGEGGQNSIGPELWEGLGVIRTEELLAARKLDGAEQYFTRAMDFGFTRSPEETLRKWNRDEILGDMVRVIRMMRPLVVVAGFSGTPQDGHGQHQVAGLLTPEAVKAAADPSRFPEQISKEGLQPWQTLKVYGRRFGQVTQGARAVFDTGAYDPALGRSYFELAADGRSRHRSQDFGMLQSRGAQLRSFPRLQSSVECPEVETTLFTGLDIRLSDVAAYAGASGSKLKPALARIEEHAAKALSEYRIERPESIAPHLAAGLREVRALRASLVSLSPALDPGSKATVDGMLSLKETQFGDALVKAYGVVVDALSNTEIVTAGETVDVTAKIYLGRLKTEDDGGKRAAPTMNLIAPAGWSVKTVASGDEAPSGGIAGFRIPEFPDVTGRFQALTPPSAAPTQPYWLTKPRVKDQFDWDDSMPRSLPFGPPLATVKVNLNLGGERVTIEQPVEYRFADKTFGEIRRELKVAPRLTLTVRPSLLVIPASSPDRSREISVEILHNARNATGGSVKLLAPAGWKVETTQNDFSFARQGEKTARTFRVTPAAGALGAFELKAVAEASVGGRPTEFSDGYKPISYPHIETHFIYRPAVTKVEVFDVNVAGNLKVGYVMGSGDDGAAALRQLGANVNLIGPAELAAGDLSVYDTIVLGIRVYEVNEDVTANNRRLLDFVSNGGTLIVQYNKQEYALGNFAPYPIKMARGDRVTDENAPITVLAPDSPLFNFPNKITTDDWKGWVQERGLYFMSDWDAHYTPLLAAPDDTGATLKGGQLIASYGKGTYIFTGYAWFRQFPAGVPGAYRLFANLVSYSKQR